MDARLVALPWFGCVALPSFGCVASSSFVQFSFPTFKTNLKINYCCIAALHRDEREGLCRSSKLSNCAFMINTHTSCTPKFCISTGMRGDRENNCDLAQVPKELTEVTERYKKQRFLYRAVSAFNSLPVAVREHPLGL